MARTIFSFVSIFGFMLILALNVSAEVADSSQVMVRLSSSDLVRFPDGKSEAAIDEVQFGSPSLENLLTACRAEEVAKTHPGFTEKDTRITDFEGRTIKIGDLTRVITVHFRAKQGADDFLQQVRTPQSLKRQKDMMNRVIRESDLARGPTQVIAEKIYKDPEVQRLIRRHAQYPEIEWAEPNYPGQYYYVPNDPRLPWQWNLRSNHGINALGAWDFETETRWPIAILDQGGMHTHLDISFSGYQTEMYAHGLAAGGIAGALTDNGRDMAGIAWNTNFGSFNTGTPLATPAQMTNAIYDAMGYGIMNITSGFNEDYWYGLGTAVRVALNSGKLLCCASGNDGLSWPAYPARWALAVGGTTNNDEVASYSNRRPDLVAPGGDDDGEADPDDILSLWFEDPFYYWWSGTSFAAPHATGVAGLLSRAYYEEQGSYQCTRNDLERLMEITATDIESPGWDVYSGWGRIDAEDALELIQSDGPYRIKRRAASGCDSYTESGGEVMTLVGVGDLPVDDFLVKKNTVYKNVTWSHPCIQVPWVWVNQSLTNGYSSLDPQYGTFWGEVVDGSVSTTGATLYTHVYEVFNDYGQRIGWYPCERHEVSFSYSVLGEFNLFQPSLAVGLVQNADNHYFHVTWADDNEYHEGYQLQYARGTPSVWTTVAELPPSCYSYNYEPVWGSQMYYFRVRATMGDSHMSPWSNEEGLRNVPNSPTDPHVTLHQTCGWPGQLKVPAEYHHDSYSPPDSLLVFPDLPENPSGTLYDLAPEPGPDPPPCFPTNRAYVSWSPPENQAAPVDYYNIRLLLYLGGMARVYWVGPFSVEACTLCLWPNKEYRLNVVAYKYGLHSDEMVNMQIFTTGEAIVCNDYSHKGTSPEDPGSEEPGIKSNLASNQYSLTQNRPNPFNPETDISYNLQEDCMVKLTIYNMLGQRVRVLVDEQQMFGSKTVHWDGRDDDGNQAASGIYFYRLQAGEYVEVRRMILLR